MRHQPTHEKAAGHGTRLIGAALVLIVSAVSITAVTVLVEHTPTVHSAQARQAEHSLPAHVAPDHPRKGRRPHVTTKPVHRPPVQPDVVAPRLEVPAAVRVRTRRSAGRIVRYRAVAVDAADGVVTVSCSPPSGSRFHAGRTVVRCSATDRAGNVMRADFVVRVRAIDVTPPRLRLPWRIERLAHGLAGVIVRYPASAADRRDGRLTARCRPASGSRFRAGFTAVRCSAADRAGNVARGRFVVVVRSVPRSVPPLLCFPDDTDDATREYSTRLIR